MASEPLLSNAGQKKEKMLSKSESLTDSVLLESSTREHKYKKHSSKLIRRIRHCHSSPHMEDGVLLEKPKETVENPSFGSQSSLSLILVGTLVLAIYLGAGIIIFFAIEHDLQGDKTSSFVDALYFCIVTMTTVGYGDLVPAGTLSKLFTCAYVFLGFGLVGLFLGSAADFLVERQEILLAKAISRNNEDPDYSEFGALHHLKKVQWKVGIAGSIVLLLFVIGLGFLVTVENLGFLEAFYCVCVTITTLGYGDVSFHTLGGRSFAVVWILVSTISVAQFYLYIAELYTEGRRQLMVKWVLNRRTTCSDLEAADMDNDGVVSPAEFVVYKLKELGKIEEQDVAEILKEFDALDVDNSGTISPYDLKLAQTAET